MASHPPKKARKTGVDALLTQRGKSLSTGQQIRVTLIKGPAVQTRPDPVNPSAPHEHFPLVAKFPESVVRPDFTTAPWNQGRLYQQDVPKAQDDSDEETPQTQQKKRWRSRNRKDPPKRQWILQEQVDFLETMMNRRQQRTKPETAATKKYATLSSRYEGVSEYNSSQYVLFQVNQQNNKNDDDDEDEEEDEEDPSIRVTLLPTNATVQMSQPAARKAFSVSEAEQAIQDQRSHMSRFMMHDSKSRLMGKLAAAGAADEDEDDVMADTTFRSGKTSSKARKELLSDLGDGVKVDDDGVLGGTDDAEYAGKQRFGSFKAEATSTVQQTNEEKDKGNDGMAMADDFYQRDVKAEYDELDYDANELFDDDDVDLGESEVVVDSAGFGGADEDDDDADDDVDDGTDNLSGAEGLATVAGFRLMLAKARGEAPPEPDPEAADKQKEAEQRRLAARKRGALDLQKPDRLDQIMFPVDNPVHKPQVKQNPTNVAPAGKKPAASVATDENGLRVITRDSIQAELWLHNGSITTKRLMKLFDYKKSNKERQAKFRDVVKELCIMQSDQTGNRMLTLKQHYSRQH